MRIVGVRRLCAGLLGAAALLLAGCAVGPDYRATKTEMPASWDGTNLKTPGQTSVAASEALAMSEWWNLLNDPTLTRLVTEALRANLDVRQAASALMQARKARAVTASGLWPSANATGAYTRSGRFSGGGGAHDLFQAGLDAAWELDFFGGVRRGIEAADASIDAAVAARNGVLVSIAAEVAIDYVNLRAFQERIGLAEKNLVAQRHTADLTRQRFNAGLVSALDVANADALVASTESAIPPLESNARQTVYALSVLLARPPAALNDELLKPGPIPLAPAKVPVGLPSELLRRRPDILQSEALVHAATAQIGVAKAAWFPQFSLTGALGFESNTLRGLLRSDSGFWSVGPSVTWPIFTAGRIEANIELQTAAQEQALLAYRQTVLTALQDVESSLVAFALEQQHRKLLDQAVAANRRAVDLSTQLYTEGQTDFLSVLDAQRSLYASEDALAQSHQFVAADLIALYKALGGGWENK